MIQNNEGLYPIHIAVTGHRDIPINSIPELKQQVRDYLQIVMLNAHSATPFKLLTGLAEGADRLVAEVALELGIKLLAVLPMAQQAYEADFQAVESLSQFKTLLSQCELIITMPTMQGEKRDDGYVKQGVFMVENAQLLLALWDGYGLDDKASIAVGGTSDVVRMALEGAPVHSDDSVLNAKHATLVHHIATPRNRHSDSKNNAIQLLNASLQTSVAIQAMQMFDQINCINTAAVSELAYSSSNSPTPASIQQSLDWLLGSALPGAAVHESLLRAYAVADTLAGSRQTKRVGSIKIVTALALLSILFQQIYSGPDMALQWITLHICFAITAFYFYKRFFDGHSQHEAQYLEWRVLSESLRVQIFWKLAGVQKPAHSAYFTNRPAEMEWIVQTMVNLNTAYCSTASDDDTDTTQLDIVQKHWVQNQADYFVGKQNKAAVNATQAQRFNLRIKWAFGLALVLTCATLVAHALGTDNDALNYLVLASGMSFVVAAVLSSYADQMGFDENAKRYESMGRLFQFAKNSIDQAIVKNDSHTAELIVSHLGIQAIQENLSWFQQHRMNAYKVQVA